mmetsp:Transcript_11609/g.29404  ORF Transcript_11609/g.29404 Transcript_11609/m.29404 type:complete len:223 (-) Transcript_11609:26-694(-)
MQFWMQAVGVPFPGRTRSSDGEGEQALHWLERQRLERRQLAMQLVKVQQVVEVARHAFHVLADVDLGQRRSNVVKRGGYRRELGVICLVVVKPEGAGVVGHRAGRVEGAVVRLVVVVVVARALRQLAARARHAPLLAHATDGGDALREALLARLALRGGHGDLLRLPAHLGLAHARLARRRRLHLGRGVERDHLERPALSEALRRTQGGRAEAGPAGRGGRA